MFFTSPAAFLKGDPFAAAQGTVRVVVFEKTRMLLESDTDTDSSREVTRDKISVLVLVIVVMYMVHDMTLLCKGMTSVYTGTCSTRSQVTLA